MSAETLKKIEAKNKLGIPLTKEEKSYCRLFVEKGETMSREKVLSLEEIKRACLEDRIAKLEKEIKRLNNIKEYNENKLLNKNYKLKQQLALTNKALELACNNVDYILTKDGCVCRGLMNENVQEIKEHFIKKAKKELKENK